MWNLPDEHSAGYANSAANVDGSARSSARVHSNQSTICFMCEARDTIDQEISARCGAPLPRPEGNGVPYTEKLLIALRHPEPETRERAATLHGVIGEPGDPRIVRALNQALEVDPRSGSMRDIGLQEAVCKSLGSLGACEASGVLSRLALDESTALLVSLSAVEILAQVAHDRCGQTGHRLSASPARQGVAQSALKYHLPWRA